VLASTFFDRYHRPPPDLGPLTTILDLGSNIGLTLADFACLHPRARMLGLELDEGNVRLCRVNIAPYSGRCEVIWGAVWNREGEVGYAGDEE
jgi:hypothetical protein